MSAPAIVSWHWKTTSKRLHLFSGGNTYPKDCKFEWGKSIWWFFPPKAHPSTHTWYLGIGYQVNTRISGTRVWVVQSLCITNAEWMRISNQIKSKRTFLSSMKEWHTKVMYARSSRCSQIFLKTLRALVYNTHMACQRQESDWFF